MNSRPTLPHVSRWLGLSALLFAGGCTLESSPDASEFSAAVPDGDSVRIAAPEARPVEGANVQADMATTAAAPARWYDFTRRATDDLNESVKQVVNTVHFVAHTIPSEVTETHARWGPFTLGDDPVAWRLVITKVAPGEYSYVMAGRPRASTAESDFRVVLSGTGYGADQAAHGDGGFLLSLDEARALNPEKFPETGKVIFKYDLPADIDQNEHALPRLVQAEFTAGDDSWGNVQSHAKLDGSGELVVSGLIDTDANASALEDALVYSVWRADGSGRAEVTISAGDTPGGGALLVLTECWGGDFARTYYADSRGLEPTFGEESVCVR